MFTGIVQGVGEVVGLDAGRLKLRPPADFSNSETWELGESIAINGCCLTAVETGPVLEFDLSPETLERTSLGDFRPGSIANLERAMRLGDRFGGHIVQGHVDATAELLSVQPVDDSWELRFRVPEDGARYLIEKGSICLDGISLTITRPKGAEFEVWIIPHTMEVTNLGRLKVGERVNVEYDVLAKHVERLLQTSEVDERWRR